MKKTALLRHLLTRHPHPRVRHPRAAEHHQSSVNTPRLTGKEAGFGQTSQHKGIVLAIEETQRRRRRPRPQDRARCRGQPVQVRRVRHRREKAHLPRQSRRAPRRSLLRPLARGRPPRPVSQDSPGRPRRDQPRRHPDAADYIFRVCFIDPFSRHRHGQVRQGGPESQKVAILVQRLQRLQPRPRQVLQRNLRRRRRRPSSPSRNFSEGDKDFRAQLTAVKAAGVGRRLRPRLLHRVRPHRPPSPRPRHHHAVLRRRRLGVRAAPQDRRRSPQRLLLLHPLLRRRTPSPSSPPS
jgi:hypothetical protein